MRRRPLVPLLLSLLACAAAQDDRIIDVKQIIKDTLDVMRSYPPPPILTQPQTMMALTQQTPLVMPDASQMASAAAHQMPQQAPLQALQSAARYGQALPVAVATTQPVHQAMAPLPLPQPPTQQELLPHRSYGPAAVAHGVSTYGGQRYYGSAIQQNTAIYNNPYTATSSQAPALPRIFATPTQTDLERLFHLPADIMHRLAADAGYIDPDPELYSKYSSSPSGSSGSGGLSGFNFNVQDGSKPAVSDIASFFLPQATTAAPRPVIVAAGTPKITTRTAVRNGKTVDLPLMIVPLCNGQTASIPYENLHDLSEAVHKIITTGELTLPETTPKSSSPEQIPPVSAVATNLLFQHAAVPQGPLQASKQGPIPIQAPIDHIQIEPPTTARPTVASTKKVVRTESNAFVQEIDETTTPAPTTTSQPTRATPPPASPTIGQEIVLNGLRYKLVDNVTGGGSNRPRLRLKSAPTRVAPGGPIPLPSETEVANFQTAFNSWLEKPVVMQQTKLTPNSAKGQPLTAQAPPQGNLPIVPVHVATIPQAAPRRQPLMATVSVPKAPPVTEAPSMESSMDEDDNNRRVTEEASHRVLKPAENHQPPAPRSYSRQYSLKELEEIINGAKDRSEESESFYRRQKETKIDMSNPESTGEKLQRPRRLTIHPMDNAYNPEKELTRSEGPVVHKRSRIEELRRKFANDRKMIAEKTKRMFRHDVAKAESHSGVTEQHCQNIRSFARQFGTLDVRAFAHNNCRFIENYYPDLKCTKVSEYMAECSKYLRF